MKQLATAAGKITALDDYDALVNTTYLAAAAKYVVLTKAAGTYLNRYGKS